MHITSKNVKNKLCMYEGKIREMHQCWAAWRGSAAHSRAETRDHR